MPQPSDHRSSKGKTMHALVGKKRRQLSDSNSSDESRKNKGTKRDKRRDDSERSRSRSYHKGDAGWRSPKEGDRRVSDRRWQKADRDSPYIERKGHKDYYRKQKDYRDDDYRRKDDAYRTKEDFYRNKESGDQKDGKYPSKNGDSRNNNDSFRRNEDSYRNKVQNYKYEDKSRYRKKSSESSKSSSSSRKPSRDKYSRDKYSRDRYLREREPMDEKQKKKSKQLREQSSERDKVEVSKIDRPDKGETNGLVTRTEHENNKSQICIQDVSKRENDVENAKKTKVIPLPDQNANCIKLAEGNALKLNSSSNVVVPKTNPLPITEKRFRFPPPPFPFPKPLGNEPMSLMRTRVGNTADQEPILRKRTADNPDQFHKAEQSVTLPEKVKMTAFALAIAAAKENLAVKPPKTSFLIADSLRTMIKFKAETLDPRWLAVLAEDSAKFKQMKESLFPIGGLEKSLSPLEHLSSGRTDPVPVSSPTCFSDKTQGARKQELKCLVWSGQQSVGLQTEMKTQSQSLRKMGAGLNELMRKLQALHP